MQQQARGPTAAAVRLLLVFVRAPIFQPQQMVATRTLAKYEVNPVAGEQVTVAGHKKRHVIDAT
jgi:hypothetical protein